MSSLEAASIHHLIDSMTTPRAPLSKHESQLIRDTIAKLEQVLPKPIKSNPKTPRSVSCLYQRLQLVRMIGVLALTSLPVTCSEMKTVWSGPAGSRWCRCCTWPMLNLDSYMHLNKWTIAGYLVSKARTLRLMKGFCLQTLSRLISRISNKSMSAHR
jgi:hypothetical protein